MIATIFDSETTGLLLPSSAPIEKQPKIIELGAIRIDLDTDEQITFNELIDPEEPISEKITKITGITNADLVGKPTFKQLSRTIVEFFKDTDILFAHNAQFDVGMLTNDLIRADVTDFVWPAEIICTVHEYTPIMGYRPRLIDLYNFVMHTPLKQSHRAVDDCKALLEVLTKDDYFRKIGAKK